MKVVYIVWVEGSQDYDIASKLLEVFSKEQDAIDFTIEYNKPFKNSHGFYDAEVIKKELK